MSGGNAAATAGTGPTRHGRAWLRAICCTALAVGAAGSEGPRITNRATVTVSLDNVNLETVEAVSFYVTRDDGATWREIDRVVTAGSTDAIPSATLRPAADGPLAFETAVTYDDGFREEPPAPGQAPRPDTRVVIDRTPPRVAAFDLALNRNRTVTVSWRTEDAHPAPTPVDIQWRDDRGRWWRLVKDQVASGQITTQPLGDAPVQAMRLMVADQAGNRSFGPPRPLVAAGDDAEADARASDAERAGGRLPALEDAPPTRTGGDARVGAPTAGVGGTAAGGGETGATASESETEAGTDAGEKESDADVEDDAGEGDRAPRAPPVLRFASDFEQAYVNRTLQERYLGGEMPAEEPARTLHLARSLLHRGKLERALDCYRSLLRGELAAEAAAEAMDLLRVRGRHREALAIAQQIPPGVNRDPVTVAQARIEIDRGRLEEAKTVLEAVPTTADRFAEAQVLRAHCLLRSRQPWSARRLLRYAARLGGPWGRVARDYVAALDAAERRP